MSTSRPDLVAYRKTKHLLLMYTRVSLDSFHLLKRHIIVYLGSQSIAAMVRTSQIICSGIVTSVYMHCLITLDMGYSHHVLPNEAFEVSLEVE
jgi:hypothetical protein